VAFLTIVSTTGLAMALCASLASVVDGLLYRPLPFPNPDRLVAVDFRKVGGQIPEVQYRPDLAGRRAALRDAIAASPLVESAAQAGAASFFSPDEIRGSGVTAHGVDAEFFRVFGLRPFLGTALSVDDERSPGATSRTSPDPLPIVIGYGLWRRAFGDDPAAIGVHQLAGRSVRIVGVMPPGVKFPGETNVWAPVSSARSVPPAYVRLADGATVEQFAGAFPDLEVVPLRDTVRSGEARGVVAIFISTLLLLIVTWVQVAGLMFSGTVSQLREIGIRLALGAGRGRLMRQFAVEATILSAAALGLAWLVVGPLTAALVTVLPSELHHGQYLEPDLRTLAFAAGLSTVGIALLTGVRLGAARRLGPAALLQRTGAGSALRAQRVRFALMVGQQALTFALLYLTALAVESFVRATTFDYGFDAERVVVFTPPPWARISATNSELMEAFAERNRKTAASPELLQNVQGVVAAATFYRGPLGLGPTVGELAPITRAGGRARNDLNARLNIVGGDFVNAIGATIVAGKSFDAPEFAGRRDIAIVNETLARQLAPRFEVLGDPISPAVIGLSFTAPTGRGMGSSEVVGVIKDFVDSKLGVSAAPQYFLPDRGPASSASGVAFRVQPAVDAVLPVAQQALEDVWGPLEPIRFTLMRDHLSEMLVQYRGQATLLAVIAACCLPIAAIGLVGALAVFVSGRRRELAIRMAIGAEATNVRWLVVRRALLAVALGALAGTGLGVASGTVIASQLFLVEPVDATAWIAVMAVFLSLAWVGAAIPGRSAARLDPAATLRLDQ
jgi:predicted permease